MTPTSGAKSASLTTYLQVVPLALVLLVFFVVPVALVIIVSFFRYQMLVGIVPDFSFRNYIALLTNATTYQRMSRAASCLSLNQDHFTVSNAICWLFLALWLLERGTMEGYYHFAKELASHSFAPEAPVQKRSGEVE